MMADDLEELKLKLQGLEYQPGHFRDLLADPLTQQLWEFLTEPINAARMETCTFCGRPAVECIAPGLLATFSLQLSDPGNDRYKQLVGHMTRQVMAALGYAIQPGRVRITRDNLFTVATRYDDAKQGPMITRGQRENWLKNTADTPFNRWLDRQTRNPDGKMSREKLRAVARHWNIDSEYPQLNAGHERMVLGCMLRRRVPKTKYEND
jgi:hypothetical protein